MDVGDSSFSAELSPLQRHIRSFSTISSISNLSFCSLASYLQNGRILSKNVLVMWCVVFPNSTRRFRYPHPRGVGAISAHLENGSDTTQSAACPVPARDSSTPRCARGIAGPRGAFCLLPGEPLGGSTERCCTEVLRQHSATTVSMETGRLLCRATTSPKVIGSKTCFTGVLIVVRSPSPLS